MVTVVAIWWGYGYLSTIFQSVEVQLFFSNLKAGNPCYLDGAYIESRRLMVATACSDLQPMPSPFQRAAVTVNQIAVNLAFWLDTSRSCNCQFPIEDTYEFRTDNGYPAETYEPLGFTRSIRNFCARRGDCTVLVNEEDIEFVGNLTLCEDTELARELILQAPDTNASPTDIWIQSGLLATLLIKFTLTNFAVALLKIADPFVVCSGQFLWIPKKFGLGLDGSDKNALFSQFKTTKEKTLFNISLRTAILWGVLMHLLLLNLMTSSLAGMGRTKTISSDDLQILQLCLGLAAVIVLLGLTFIFWLKRKPRHASLDSTLDGDDDDYSVEE